MLRVAATISIALFACTPAVAAQTRSEAPVPVVDIRLQPDPAHPAPRFEGWGTALAWFANRQRRFGRTGEQVLSGNSRGG